MAISEQAGFSGRGGAPSTDLGQALSLQLDRLKSRLRAGVAARPQDTFSGISFEQLEPGLAREIGTPRRF